MQQYKRLSNITTVAPNNTFSIQCPVGPTYELILLDLTNITLAQLTNIEVLLNGKQIQVFGDGQELQDINNYYSRHDNFAGDGILPLWLSRPEYENTLLERAWAFGTANVSTLQVQAKVDAAAVNPGVEAVSIVDTARRPLEALTKVKRFPRTFATSGEQEIDNIPRGPRIQAVHFKKSDVNNVRMLLDGQEVRDITKERAQWLQEAYGRTPVTARFTHMDFHLEGQIDQFLITAGLQEMRFLPELGSSGDLTTIIEYADQYAGI